MPRRRLKNKQAARNHNGHAPQQHFLGSRAARRIVASADLRSSDLVLEFGAGGGALTEHLAARSGRVIAVERDPYWAERLRRRFRDHRNVEVITGDALSVPLPSEPFRVVANIPFAITTALLHRLLDDPRVPLDRAHLVLQWETARKYTRRQPTSLKTLAWSPWHRFSLPLRLPATAFRPAPKATAGLLVAAKRGPPLVPVCQRDLFNALLVQGFTGRGLLIGKTLRPVFTKPQLQRLASDHGFDLRSRPSDLDARQWAAIFNSMTALVPRHKWPRPRTALRKRRKLLGGRTRNGDGRRG